MFVRFHAVRDLLNILAHSTDGGMCVWVRSSTAPPPTNKTESVARNFSGLVHYTSELAEYLENLEICLHKPTMWTAFRSTRTILSLHNTAPCKLYQKHRDNFVFFHAAELGLQFEDKTVLALYKTPAGRNHIADMREGVNMLQLDFVTDPAFFVTSLSENTGITEMQMVPGNILYSTSVDSYGVDTYGSAEQYFVGDVCNYTGVEGANQRANASIVLAVFVPDPLLGQTPNHDYATLLDAGGSVPLLFQGVYTITETSGFTKWMEILPSIKKTCINVLKRTATEAQKTHPGIIQRVPLEYDTLVDTLPQKSTEQRKITDYVGAFYKRKPRTASVVNGACTDRLFFVGARQCTTV